MVQWSGNRARSQSQRQFEFFRGWKVALATFGPAFEITVDLALQIIERAIEIRSTSCEDTGFSSVSDRGESISRSEEHPSELQSSMRSSHAVSCLQQQNVHTRVLRIGH